MMMKESLAHYFDYFFASKSLHLVDKCTQNWLHRRYHHARAREPQELVFLVFCILKRQNCLCHFHPFSIKEPPFRNCIVLAKECRITHVERHLAVLSKALPKKLWKRRTLYDFLRQSPRGQKQKQKFRDLEKVKYRHNQAMDLKFKGTVRKPTKFTLRKYIDDLPVYLVKFGEFWG